MTDTPIRKEQYLRNRPFLLVTSKHRPAQSAKTNVKGWGEHPANWSHFERPEVVDRVNARHLTECTVIIDVINSAIVKNQLQNDDQDVVNHYLTKYKEYVSQALDIWLTQLAQTVAKQSGDEIVAKAVEIAAAREDAAATDGTASA